VDAIREPVGFLAGAEGAKTWGMINEGWLPVLMVKYGENP
jgi:hypothetical protein